MACWESQPVAYIWRMARTSSSVPGSHERGHFGAFGALRKAAPMAFEGARGNGGEVRIGGRVAATITDWSASYDGATETWSVGAGLSGVVDLWLDGAQTCDLRLKLGRAVWRWRTAPYDRVGNAISAHPVGRFEEVFAPPVARAAGRAVRA